MLIIKQRQRCSCLLFFDFYFGGLVGNVTEFCKILKEGRHSVAKALEFQKTYGPPVPAKLLRLMEDYIESDKKEHEGISCSFLAGHRERDAALENADKILERKYKEIKKAAKQNAARIKKTKIFIPYFTWR